MMRLAKDILTIAHGTDAVRLSPSLRAALHLQRKHGLGRLVQGLDETSVTVILDIVDAGSGNDPIGRRIIADTLAEKGVIGLLDYRPALEDFLIDCFGIDDEEHPAERRERQTGKPLSIKDSLADFFQIGTGWLGWTPAETWAATPAEIVAAQRGLIAKLKAIHGSNGDQLDEHDDDDISPTKLRQNLDRLKQLAKGAA